MNPITDLVIIIIVSAVIYFSGKRFAESSSNLGDYLRMPRSVKGATFDAISSSFPELMIAVYSILAFGKFEVGIGTIAGSALFNLLVIPAVAVLASPAVFKVGKEAITRDGMFYTISVFALMVVLLYFKVWGLAIPLVLLAIYIWYITYVIKDTRNHRLTAEQNKTAKKISVHREVATVVINVIIIGFATFFLTESAISFSEAVGIPPIVIAFTIVAAATSVPDGVICFVNARKGDFDDAVSNVFGSNIFDILIGLSLPVIMAVILFGPVEIVFNQIEIIIGLLGATIVILFFLAESNTLKRNQAWFMLAAYLFFIGYVVFLSINGFA